MVLFIIHGFASRRMDEYGATLYVFPIPGTPSGTTSSGDSRLVSTWIMSTSFSNFSESRKQKLQKEDKLQGNKTIPYSWNPYDQEQP